MSDGADRMTFKSRHRKSSLEAMTEVRFNESLLSTLEGKVAIITGSFHHTVL